VRVHFLLFVLVSENFKISNSITAPLPLNFWNSSGLLGNGVEISETNSYDCIEKNNKIVFQDLRNSLRAGLSNFAALGWSEVPVGGKAWEVP